MPAALLLILLLCGCAVTGENGKFQIMDSMGEDGRGCKGYMGKRVVLKCKF
jgi:hypothetical protein